MHVEHVPHLLMSARANDDNRLCSSYARSVCLPKVDAAAKHDGLLALSVHPPTPRKEEEKKTAMSVMIKDEREERKGSHSDKKKIHSQ